MSEHDFDLSSKKEDIDLCETQEWLESLQAVVQKDGWARARFLMERLVEQIATSGEPSNFLQQTPYVNSISENRMPEFPGNAKIEHRIRAYIRWNAIMMVLRANQNTNVGGHIASFQSAAVLYDTALNHFWLGADDANNRGDLIFFQGHSSPGIYAYAYLLGRLDQEDLDGFRQESEGTGISSYPHPWLMPNFWQFPTVSMGLGPLMAIYQARFMRYLICRDHIPDTGRKVWAFLGDGETDEPESLGAIGMAGREGLDNLIFVINCNLQRLDGPVRGNGKIIQELEAEFRGAGWHVIKVVWGRRWDPILARDTQGLLTRRMMEVVDGEYQTFKSKDGAYVREHFFNTPELKALVADMSDEEIWSLNRGGHDPHKVYAAYHEAVNHKGQPTVILAKTVKGYGMGAAGEAQNITHQQKKMTYEDLKAFRDRFHLALSDEQVKNLEYVRFSEDSEEFAYLKARRDALGGKLPFRYSQPNKKLEMPQLDAFSSFLRGSEGREISTTMSFVRILGQLMKNKQYGRFVVPIVPDESRTFGMEGMFRQFGIWSQQGQKYVPQDKGQLMFYKEDVSGQILQEGINEAGGFSDWVASATSYSTYGVTTIPFYIFYSMFGFQRIADFAWAASDMRSRGFLLGGTAGRTTLNGEGLQHEDGHSHIFSSVIPNCVSYDPTFQHELAVIIQHGLHRMIEKQEDVYFYITLMNENYEHPPIPENQAENIVKGMYLLQSASEKAPLKRQVQLLGSGSILREVQAAAVMLWEEWEISANIWSCPSWTELARDGWEVDRWNRLHPEQAPKQCHVSCCLDGTAGPVIASTDYVRSFAEQIRPWIKNRDYMVLGTDGFGRSDTRERLRDFFEVDRRWIVLSTLSALVEAKVVKQTVIKEAMQRYGISAEKKLPWKC